MPIAGRHNGWTSATIPNELLVLLKRLGPEESLRLRDFY